MWRYFRNGVLDACDEVCWMKRGRRSEEDTWWCNDEVKEAISRETDVHRTMCRNSTEKSMKWYKSMKNELKKAVYKAMREKA